MREILRMFSLDTFQRQYATDTQKIVVRNRKFNFFTPKSIDRFIDSQDVFHDFPLWAKVWEASIILADYLAGIPAEPKRHTLEIGCGLGVAGIVASSFGHRVTMTESNPHALDFARANAEINGLSGDAGLEILSLDWNTPRLAGLYDRIMGSEIIYSRRDYDPLLNLLQKYLKPKGEVILAEGVRETSVSFFRKMGQFFDIKAHKKVLRSERKEFRVLLCKMQLKRPAVSP